MNVFNDQERFMVACGQSVSDFNVDQFNLYRNLITEEVEELAEATESDDRVEMLDALIDILVVTIGAIHSMGANGPAAWDEVMRTNFEKIDPVTGKVHKRADGKVIKPANWLPPQLAQYIKK